MPNSINRRRISSVNENSDEVEKLKQEIQSLKEMYITDMANVSADMRNLNSQIVSNSSVDLNTVDTSTSPESNVEETLPDSLTP